MFAGAALGAALALGIRPKDVDELVEEEVVYRTVVIGYIWVPDGKEPDKSITVELEKVVGKGVSMKPDASGKEYFDLSDFTVTAATIDKLEKLTRWEIAT